MVQDKKIILFLEDSSKSFFGGGQAVSLQVIEALSETFSVQLFDCNGSSEFVKLAKPHINGFYQLISLKGLFEVVLLPVFLWINFFRLSKFIKKSGLKKEIIFLYAATRKVLILVWLIHKMFGLGFIYHAHRIENKKSFLEQITFFTMKSAKKIICVSNAVRESIALPQCEVLYNSIEVSYAKPKVLQAKVNVAVFSSLFPLKGIQYFVQSFSFLKNAERVHYFIYGEGPLRNKFKPDKTLPIHWMGFSHCVNELLKTKIDLVVIPSVHAESFSMILLEALSQGVPVIAKELIEHQKVGVLIEPKSPQKIAERIDYFIDHPDIYAEFSKNALAFSKQFDVNQYRKKILALLDL